MMCCICNEKEAKVHLTQIDGDKMQKVDLCEDCARTKGANDPTGYALAELFLGLGTSQGAEPPAAAAAELRCPRCGFSQTDLKKVGRLGCPQCYPTFAETLGGLLKNMHKGTRHVGKVPGFLRQDHGASDRLNALQKKLNKAVEAENFEEAARLRDEIRQAGARQSTPAAT